MAITALTPTAGAKVLPTMRVSAAPILLNRLQEDRHAGHTEGAPISFTTTGYFLK
jgi:hypothetical protein